MRPTIGDVARHAGTSASTVSRFLNKSGYVSEETQQRIEQAIENLGYEPSRMARQMKGKPIRLIGLIVPYIDSIDYATYTQAVTEALRLRGYDLILCVNNENPEIDLRHLMNLKNQRVDGILYCHPAHGANAHFLRQLVEQGMPVVEVMRHRDKDFLYAVISDEERAAYRQTQYLLERGHRRIAFVSGWPQISGTRHHLEGYERALRDAGIPLDPALVHTGESSRRHGEISTLKLLDLADPPSALFSTSEPVFFGTIAALQKRNMRVPDDISLVSNSPAEWLRIWNPPITITGTPISSLASTAVDVLLRSIETPAEVGKPVTYFLDAPMIEGGSVKTLIRKE